MRITPSRGTRLEDPNTDGSGYMGNNVGGGEIGAPSSEGGQGFSSFRTLKKFLGSQGLETMVSYSRTISNLKE